MTLKDGTPQVGRCPNILLKSGAMAPEGMKRLNQRGNDTQLWMSGGESKVQCCKKQYCIGTWNHRSMNQGKLEVVKHEMASVDINILGISELKWMRTGNLSQMTSISTTMGEKPFEEME